MPTHPATEKKRTVQARLTPAQFAVMTAQMHAAGFGLVSEYLTYLATSDLASRRAQAEPHIGKIGLNANRLILKCQEGGLTGEKIDRLADQILQLQIELARGLQA